MNRFPVVETDAFHTPGWKPLRFKRFEMIFVICFQNSFICVISNCFQAISDLDQLSTSQSPFYFDEKISRTLDLYPAGGAFAPQREDGYGVFYLFLGDNFSKSFVISVGFTENRLLL